MSKKKPLAIEIVWSQLLLCGGEWKTRKAIYEELIAEGFERRYVDWYLFCLSQNQPKEKELKEGEEIPIKVSFRKEEIGALPLFYINGMSIQVGMDDFFIVLGSITNPRLTDHSIGYISQSDELSVEAIAKPMFRFAASPLVIERFIHDLQSTLERYKRKERENA